MAFYLYISEKIKHMEQYEDDSHTFSHVDDWLDDDEEDDDWDDDQDEDCLERGGCMPDPEDFDD
jgi:hypothetical protein